MIAGLSAGMEAEITQPEIVHDLGIVVMGAAAAALLFARLRLPVIFGYMLAGLLLGPNLFAWSPIKDEGAVREMSELGIIFLLFFVGMEFDLRRLRNVAVPALAAVVLQTAAMLSLANLLGPLMGWTPLSSLFFGSLLSISSSMVTVRVLRDQRRLQHSHAQLTVGILILEDILAVVLLVVLSGVAVREHFDWGEAWVIVFFMGLFVAIVFFAGRLAAPTALRWLARAGSMELITLFSAGLVLGVSVLALKLEFSLALGAFLAGAIISHSPLAKEIGQANRSLHDLFCAVFFVSVGMMIHPKLVLENIGWVAVLSLLTVAGKTGACWLGLFLAGQPPRSGFRAALAKAQIGEFSFIIAGLGQTLGVTNARLVNITFGVALCTILATPGLSARSLSMYEWLTTRAPRSLLLASSFYRHFLRTAQSVLGRSVFLKLVRRPLMQITAYFFIICGIILGSAAAAERARRAAAEAFAPWASAGVWMAAAALLAPFVIAIARNVNAMGFMLMEAVFRGRSPPSLPARWRNFLNTAAASLLLLWVGGGFFSAAAPYLPRGTALFLFLGLIFILAVFFWRQMIRLNNRLELLFLESFSEQTRNIGQERRSTFLQEISRKYPWPAEIGEVEIRPESAACGKPISALKPREKTGGTIIALGRAGYHFFDPNPAVPVCPGDRLYVLGNPEQIRLTREIFAEQRLESPAPPDKTDIRIEKIFLPPGCPLEGNTLAGADLRRRHRVTVIGIQRAEKQITSPPPGFLLKGGDILVIAGAEANLRTFQAFADPRREPENSNPPSSRRY